MHFKKYHPRRKKAEDGVIKASQNKKEPHWCTFPDHSSNKRNICKGKEYDETGINSTIIIDVMKSFQHDKKKARDWYMFPHHESSKRMISQKKNNHLNYVKKASEHNSIKFQIPRKTLETVIFFRWINTGNQVFKIECERDTTSAGEWSQNIITLFLIFYKLPSTSLCPMHCLSRLSCRIQPN